MCLHIAYFLLTLDRELGGPREPHLRPVDRGKYAAHQAQGIGTPVQLGPSPFHKVVSELILTSHNWSAECLEDSL